MRRRLIVGIACVLALAFLVNIGTVYVRAASLVVRAAGLGGRMETLAQRQARSVTVHERHKVPTRYGEVAAQFYTPAGGTRRTVLLIPGIHSMGIAEPRLTALADDLAGAGLTVMTMAPPDLQTYRITPRATDVIEDAVSWMAVRPDLTPDGRVGIVGISFAGGLSIAAASRPAIRERVAFVLSFGGHGDLPRVLRYLATGVAPQVPGIETHPPHDYGLAVILYGLADKGVVPADQVDALRQGVETFLLASQLTLVSMDQANALFAKARELAAALPEPSRTYMGYVNDRAVGKLGPVLAPHLEQLGADDPALSPQRVERPPLASLYLLHGHDDTVIPAAESAVLADALRRKGVNVRVLLSGLITHAEVNRAATALDAWKLVSFWAKVLEN
jgi:dienelactone hydrolase